MMFNFFVNQHLFYALACGGHATAAARVVATRNLPATAQWGQFLRNHDELDLGRLMRPSAEKVFERFGPEQRHAAVSPRYPPASRTDAGATAATSSLLTACSSPCPGLRSFATAMRSAWAMICR